MKAWLLVFDLATLLLVISMLSLCRLPVGLSVAYSWCPLLLKEVANSGHLDSIAVFFCTLSIYLFLLAINRAKESERRFFHPGLTGSAIALAAGVGAKLFPIVLLPLLILVGGKKCGWRAIVLPGIAFTTLTIALLWPMLPQSWKSGAIFRSAQVVKPATSAETDPGQGMTAFLKSWEMNDLMFMIVIENLKPADQFPKNETVWFSFVPDERREQISELTQATFATSPSETPFLIARFLTTIIFGLLAIWLAWRASQQTNLAAVGLAALLTIAWFWLLSPTQNPWYWIWALPFLPFAHNRAWYAVSGFVLLYYLRFWFRYHFTGVEVLNTPYMGTNFFDYVLPWIEFGPFLVWLAVEGWIRGKGSKESDLIASL